MNRFFEEHQYQRRLLPWLCVLSLWAITIWYLYNQCLSDIAKGAEIFILILLPLAVTVLIAMFHLSVKIDKNYLMFKMFPFHLKYKKIRLDEIKNATIKEYNTDRSFHGWGLGITWNRKYKSYTVKGYKGVEISLKDGMKIFIGTQRPEDLIENLNIG